ncbi:hypothetical protein NMG60_11024123 [Bertholletia excelsa]
MDPSTDLPSTAAPPAPATEPPAHTAHVANPTPHQLPNNNHNHPSYAEMITSAITALKEKNGSSRQAIAKYIEKAYANLPSTHSALLTHHLKRLKNSGQLVMVKHSYMLPGPRSISLSSSPSSSAPPNSSPTPNTYPNPNPISHPNPNSPHSGPKRGPGRPPKPKADAQPFNNPPVGPETMLFSLGLTDGPGPASASAGPIPVPLNPASGPLPEPVPVPVAGNENLSPGGAKRKPGRPPKANGKMMMMMGGSGAIVGVKRGRGRPPRPKSLTGLNMMGQNGQRKKGRGRPPMIATGGVAMGMGRPRGRPRKKNAAVAAATLSLMRTGSNTGRPRGRPPKNAVAAALAASGADGGGGPLVNVGGGVGGVLPMPMKRRGRPPGASGLKKPRKLSGKPLGRPRKNMSVTGGSLQAAAAQLAYEDLKNKVQHFQDRIKQAVSVVKPHLNSETAVIALGALQELEELATMDLSVPVHAQPQVQVQVQVQAQAQAQAPQTQVQEPIVSSVPNQAFNIASF